MSLISLPAHRLLNERQDHSLALPEKQDSNPMIIRPQPRRSATDDPGLSSPLASSNLLYSSLPSPGRPTPDKGRRKPVPSMTGDLDDSLSQRHLSEDISRYPSTISGHIGQATRDDRFAHATGPYHLVPVNEFGVRVDVPRQVKMLSSESRDPTCSSFEAFVLAPSTSSFTIYDKLKPTMDKADEDEATEQAVRDPEGKERKVPMGPSPLQNQVKVSMESRRTVNYTKQSSDTVRSGHSIIDTSQSITKSKTSWSLFSRINTSPHTESTGHRDSYSSDAEMQSSPTKPSPQPNLSPSTRRQLRKLSVQPVSPFQVPLSHDVSRRKDAARTAEPSTDEHQMNARETSISSPASAKTIKSFSALHRPSMDTPTATQKYRGRVSSDVTPTKQKRQPPRTEGASLGRNVNPPAGTFPQPPSLAVLLDPPRRVNSGIKLVTNDHPAQMPTSRNGLPRVDTRYLDDDDLCVRLETHERDQRAGKEPVTSDADVQSGYWDYSIVTGIGGSPSRDYLSLLRNASMMKEFSKITDTARSQEKNMSPRTDTGPTVASSSSAMATHTRNSSTLTAPRSSSDKSLTCSSNYPDDTDDISENSHNKYSEKRRGRHARRRRPVSMASLGEDPLEGVLQAEGVEVEARALRDDVTEVADECQPSLQVCARGNVLGSITPAESSFAQSLPEITTDTEASTLFTRFPAQSSLGIPPAVQSEHFKSFGIGLRFPVPPQSQKHFQPS